MLDGGGGCNALSALPPGKAWYPSFRKLGGPQGRSGHVWNVLPPPGFDPRTVQPKACHCTDWAIVWRLLPTYRLGHYWFIFTQIYVRCLLQYDYFHKSLVFGKASLGWHHESHKVLCIYVHVFSSQTGGCVCIGCLFCFSYVAAAITWQQGGPWLLVTCCYDSEEMLLHCHYSGNYVTHSVIVSCACLCRWWWIESHYTKWQGLGGIPRNFVRGAGSTNSVEDRENRDLGAVAP